MLIDGHALFEKGGAGLKGRDYYRAVQPIFQNPFEAFSARKKVDRYLFDAARRLRVAQNRKEAREIVAEALESVGLDLSRVEGKYANQFSGGELQRISVARSLIPRPKLIVADEPVSMIDASLRMNIVNLFLDLKERYKVSFVYITHDLSTAYYVSDYIAIMYRGSVVEYGPSEQILTDSAHPYTELLLDSVPTVDHKWERGVQLPDIEIKEFSGAKLASLHDAANTFRQSARVRRRRWCKLRTSGRRSATGRSISSLPPSVPPSEWGEANAARWNVFCVGGGWDAR